MWIHVFRNWKTNFIFKNGRTRSSTYETKASIHLSRWVKRAYGAQLWKERWLLRESAFISIKKWTLIPRMVEREVLLMKSKYQFIYPNEENVVIVLNLEMKGDYYVIHVYHNWKTNFNFKNSRRKVFLIKPKHQYH